MTFPSTIVFRPAVSTDLPFIQDSWRKSYRDSEFARNLTDDVYRALMDDTIPQLVSNSQALVATLSIDDHYIAGYLIHGKKDETTLIHYLYVKDPHRSQGLAQALFDQASPSTPAVCSHITRKFHYLRAVHLLPIMSLPEYEEMTAHHQPFGEWFLSKLPTLRKQRDRLLQEKKEKQAKRPNPKPYGAQ